MNIKLIISTKHGALITKYYTFNDNTLQLVKIINESNYYICDVGKCLSDIHIVPDPDITIRKESFDLHFMNDDSLVINFNDSSGNLECDNPDFRVKIKMPAGHFDPDRYELSHIPVRETINTIYPELYFSEIKDDPHIKPLVWQSDFDFDSDGGIDNLDVPPEFSTLNLIADMLRQWKAECKYKYSIQFKISYLDKKITLFTPYPGYLIGGKGILIQKYTEKLKEISKLLENIVINETESIMII